MEELKAFLNDFPHVQVVYFVGKDWYINVPNMEHKVKTREEILDGKSKTKAELKAEAKAQAEEEARKEAELKAEADSNEAQD